MAAAMPLQPTRQTTPFLMVPQSRGDEACAQLSPFAFKIWYRITRLTCGFHKDEAPISYTDFQEACGIKDRHTISKAIAELVKKGFVRVVQNIVETGRKLTSVYGLLEGSGKNPLPLVEKIHYPSVKKSTTPSGKNPPLTACETAPEEARREAKYTSKDSVKDTKKESEAVQPATPTPAYDQLLETLHQSNGFKADKGKDLLLFKALQHYPVEWLLETATAYAFADGIHNYNGFKNWVNSQRAQENLRKWEAMQAQLRRAQEPVRFKTRKELDEEDARIATMMEQERKQRRAQEGYYA